MKMQIRKEKAKKQRRAISKKKILLIILIAGLIIIACVLISFILKNKEMKKSCDFFSVDKCPERCVICPPCEVCSSISCKTKEFCESIGFNKSWHENIIKGLEQYEK
jgi:hypothetical protein